jgi:hypothetical protein
MEENGSTMKPAKEATTDETLADIEENESEQDDQGNSDDVASPDGALDEEGELKDADPL